MKIAIFSNTYKPTVNGVAVSIDYLREGLEKAGHTVHIFAPAPNDYDRSLDGDYVHRFRSLDAPVEADYQLAWPFSSDVSEALRELRFDLVHSHHPLWVGDWALWYARWLKIPLVTTIHTQYELYSHMVPLPQAMLDTYLQAKVMRYCNICDLVTTPAESSKERLKKIGVTKPIEVIYNPTKLEPFWHADGAEVRKLHNCTPDDYLLGYIGRLSPEKNLGALLDAAEIILSQEPTAKLMIVGDGPSRKDLEKRASKIASPERIIFTGKVNYDQIPNHCAALDVFVTPSVSEVQPLTFAEAMAAGTPVIAFDVAGCNDMVQDGLNGRLIPTSQKGKGIARVVLEVMHNQTELIKMGKSAREWARRYDQPMVVEQMLGAYAKATENNKKRKRFSII